MPLIRIPTRLSDTTTNNVYNAEVPSSGDWRRFANDANFLKAKGAQLIPVSTMDTEAIYLNLNFLSSAVYVWEVPLFPNKQALERVWEFEITGALWETAPRLNLTINSNHGPANGWSLPAHPFSNNRSLVRFVEPLTASQHSAFEKVQISASVYYDFPVDPVGDEDSYCHIRSISCFEVPRVMMDFNNATDDRVMNPESCGNIHPIFGDIRTPPIESVYAVAFHLSESIHDTRRVGMFMRTAPLSISGSAFNGIASGAVRFSNTIVDAFDLAPRVQSRRIFASETTRRVWVYSLATKNEAGNRTVTTILSSSYGGTAAITQTIPGSDVPTWLSASINLSVDGITDDGLPTEGGMSNSLRVRYFNSAASTVKVHTIFIGETE